VKGDLDADRRIIFMLQVLYHSIHLMEICLEVVAKIKICALAWNQTLAVVQSSVFDFIDSNIRSV
jgi:hypothetical protein